MSLKNERFIVIGLIGLQLALCIPVLNSFPIGLDEPFSIFYAQQDFSEMWVMFSNENNPPLHFMLLHYWMELFGNSPWSVRSLSLLFSVLAIPVIWTLGRKILTTPYAVLFVLFFILGSFNHYHAVEARVYSLFVLLFALVFLELYKMLFDDRKSFRKLAFWNALLLYSHYLGGFVIVTELLILLIFFRKMTLRKWGSVGISLVISGILYIPGIQLFFSRIEHFSGKGTWVPEAHWTELYGNIVRFCNSKWAVVALGAAGLICAVVALKKNRAEIFTKIKSSKVLFVTLAFAIPYLGLFVMSKVFQPVFLDRYLLFTTVPLFLGMALLLEIVSDKITKGWLALAFVLPFAITSQYIPANNRADDELAAYVRKIKTPGTGIFLCPEFYDLTFMYYYDRSIFEDYKNFDIRQADERISSLCVPCSFNSDTIIWVDAGSEFIYSDRKGVHESRLKSPGLMNDSTFAGNYHVTQIAYNKVNED